MFKGTFFSFFLMDYLIYWILKLLYSKAQEDEEEELEKKD